MAVRPRRRWGNGGTEDGGDAMLRRGWVVEVLRVEHSDDGNGADPRGPDPDPGLIGPVTFFSGAGVCGVDCAGAAGCSRSRARLHSARARFFSSTSSVSLGWAASYV